MFGAAKTPAFPTSTSVRVGLTSPPPRPRMQTSFEYDLYSAGCYPLARRWSFKPMYGIIHSILLIVTYTTQRYACIFISNLDITLKTNNFSFHLQDYSFISP